MENSPAAPRDLSKMTDAELDAAIGQASEAAPRDFSKMTDEELDASISAASAPTPTPAPTFDFDDVAKGMSADESSRAARYPKVAQSMLDRHATFTGRMGADGGFKLSGDDESDYEYFKWADRRGVFGGDPAFTDYAGAVGKSLWQIVKGGAKLAVLAGKVAVSGDSNQAPAVELAATAVDAARLAKSEYEQLGAGAAVLLSGENPEVKSAAKFELLKFSTSEQKNHNAWRKALSDRFAEVPVDEDSVEALSEAFDISNLIGAGAGKAVTRAARAAGVGGTEWLDASRKVIGSEMLARGIAKIPVIGTSQKRAILTGQVDLLSVEAELAYKEVASAQSTLAGLNATLAANGAAGASDPILAAVAKSQADVATATTSYKAAQTQLDGARRAVSDVLDLEGRGLLNIATAGTVDAAGKVTTFAGDTLTSGWSATKKFVTGSSDNALADAVAPGIVSHGNVVSRAGRDLSGIAAQIRANGASIPFFRRVAQAEGIGKLTKAGAAFADFSHLAWVADKGSELVGAGLAGAPVSGAFGYVASGGDTLAAAGSAGGGMAFGISGGAYGQWQSYTDPRFRHEELLSNRRQFRDHLSVRPVNGQSQLQVFDSMDAGEQLLLSTYAQGHPDVAFRLINDDKGPSGYYDRDNNVVVLNRASKTSIPDIFRHEVAHFIERHGMEAQVRELYLGDAEKGVVGQYTAVDSAGKPIDVPSVGPDGQPTRIYLLNGEGEALRLQYEKKVQAFDPTFTMSREYFASELFAEQYADHVVNGGMRRDLSRNAVDSTFEALASVPLLKGFMGGIGLMFDQNETVVGTEVFSGMARSAGVVDLISAWNSESGQGRRGSGVEEPDAHVFTERELRDPAVATKWLQGGGAMRFGPDGAPVYNADGTPQFLTDKESEAAQRDLANELIVAIERHAVDNPEDADVMQRRENVDINGKTSVTYSGRKIPASVIDALEAQKRFNPHQLAHLRAMSASVEQHGVGAMIAHFYQAASRKLSGKAYKTTGGRWRRDGVVGFQITKDGNVLANSVSWEQLAESARKAASTAAARDLYQSSGVDIAAAITADTKTYLENVVAGRPGSEGLGDKRRDFINNLFGIRMASNEDVNPFFATTKSPKPILTSLRLDRINRLAPLDSVEFAWGPAQYRQVKANLRPDSAIDSAAAGDQTSENGDRLRQYRPEPGSKVEPGQVQHGNKKLEHSIGDEFVNLVHYSSNGGLTNVDPKSLGKGLATQNDLRGLPKSFYFVQGSKLGTDRDLVSGQGKSTYVAKVSGNRIYDANADAHGYWDIINREKADQMLVDKGFAGLAVTGGDGDGRSTVTLFKKTNVQKMDTNPKEKRAGANLSFRPDATLGENSGFADVPSDSTVVDALSSEKKQYVGAHRDLATGHPVGLRIDIPAFLRTGKYVVTVHEKATGGSVGKRIGYDGVATVDNPKFYSNEVGAQKIRDGVSNKFPIATVEGAFNPSRTIPVDINSWTPTGFDPKEHSYFYDKRTGEPVVGGSQAISVGNSVFVKDAVFGNKENFQFRPDAVVFASPNKVELNYETAKAALGDAQHAAFSAAAQKFAPDAKVESAIGDWADGAENTVALTFDKPITLDETRKIAARLGIEGDQKAVLHLIADPTGPDALHEVTFPAGMTLDAARQSMIDAGLEFRTLVPREGGVTGYVFDSGLQLGDQLTKLLSNANITIESTPARGEFLGSWTDRAEGVAKFREVLGETGSSGSQAGVQNQGGNSAGAQFRPDAVPGKFVADKDGFIPHYITPNSALPTVVIGKNKSTDVPTVTFAKYLESEGRETPQGGIHAREMQKSYLGLSKETYGIRDPRSAAEAIASDLAANITFLHDLAVSTFGKDIVDRMSKWYDGANKIAKDFAKIYGVTVEQSAAILAVMSPQKNWFANVSLAENVMDVLRNHSTETFDAGLTEYARGEVARAEASASATAVLNGLIDKVSGKRFEELTDLKEKALFVRFFSQQHHPKESYNVSPEGGLKQGSSVQTIWGGLGTVAKAISIFEDGSVANLTRQLGEGHKVRNFNGNIIDPESPLFFTSDTHNVAAALLTPFGGSAWEVKHNFGGNEKGSPRLARLSVSRTGLNGTYPMYQEAGNRAAASRNILPRQMQSISWEMVRILFPEDMKTDGFMESVKAVHAQTKAGTLSVAQAREAIIELAGGREALKARPPEWLNQ